jgi:hypothetical protein
MWFSSPGHPHAFLDDFGGRSLPPGSAAAAQASGGGRAYVPLLLFAARSE